MIDGPGGDTYLFHGTSLIVAWLWLDVVYLFICYCTYLRGLNLAQKWQVESPVYTNDSSILSKQGPLDTLRACSATAGCRVLWTWVFLAEVPGGWVWTKIWLCWLRWLRWLEMMRIVIRIAFCFVLFPLPPQFLTTPLMHNYQHVREIQRRRRWHILLAVNMIPMATLVMLESVNTKEPYHTSILTGEGWVQELLNRHPERICCEIGIHLHVFTELVSQLRSIGHTKFVCLIERIRERCFLSLCHKLKKHLSWRTSRHFPLYLCYGPNHPACERTISAIKWDCIIVSTSS
jgi:hypothetical protein